MGWIFHGVIRIVSDEFVFSQNIAMAATIMAFRLAYRAIHEGRDKFEQSLRETPYWRINVPSFACAETPKLPPMRIHRVQTVSWGPQNMSMRPGPQALSICLAVGAGVEETWMMTSRAAGAGARAINSKNPSAVSIGSFALINSAAPMLAAQDGGGLSSDKGGPMMEPKARAPNS